MSTLDWPDTTPEPAGFIILIKLRLELPCSSMDLCCSEFVTAPRCRPWPCDELFAFEDFNTKMPARIDDNNI